jgi:hypothetical protein
VTEAEWLAAIDPGPMSGHVISTASGRKLRLFACACCRRIWPLLAYEQSRAVVEASEQAADGLLSPVGLRERYTAASIVNSGPRPEGELVAARAAASTASVYPLNVIGHALAVARAGEGREQSRLLRCVFGNPFRPAAIAPAWLAWNGGTVTRLAELAYQERELPAGHLSPARLALVADALEDAGCGEAEILGHLREPGPHVRGCWVVDRLTGRS